MAAPSGTIWGTPTVGKAYGGRPGIYVSTSNTATQTKVTVQIWYWSQYSCQDNSNDFYFNFESNSAVTSIGSKSINTGSNTSWSTANQVKIAEFTKVYNRDTSNHKYYCATKFTGIEYGGGNSSTVYTEYTIPKRDVYTIKYNANGGSGAPGSQTKQYGLDILLSNTIPTRMGYNFMGWSDSSSGGVKYNSGDVYKENKSITLYAVWSLKQCSVIFDAYYEGATVNGEKNYGISVYYGFKIGSLPIPEYSGHKFLGWFTNPVSGGIQINDSTVIYNDIVVYPRFELMNNCYLKQSDVYSSGMMSIKDREEYKSGKLFVKVNGDYKEQGA